MGTYEELDGCRPRLLLRRAAPFDKGRATRSFSTSTVLPGRGSARHCTGSANAAREGCSVLLRREDSRRFSSTTGSKRRQHNRQHKAAP